MTPTWLPTFSLYRAGLTSVPVILVAVLTGRPDLLLLGVPLLVTAVAGVVRRPVDVPVVEGRLGHASLREGEGTLWRGTIRRATGVEHVAVALTPHRWVVTKPEHGVVGRASSPSSASSAELELELPVASMRWGHRRVGDGLVAATSAWAGFRYGPVRVAPRMLATLPLPGLFDSRAPAPHPIGLVGANPARRPGDGSEFAGIRPFAAGDRLRRVQWRVSLRTGALHVTSTVAEQDSSILLVLDAGIEVGAGRGVNSPPSSLDVGVRAAGAIAEHYLHHGDRVGLRVLGSTALNAVHTGAGQRHLRRILDTLARVVPGEPAQVDPATMHFGAPGGSIVIMLSPMLSEQAVTATMTLAHRGLDVVVVDTVPEGLRARPPADRADRVAQVAWRLRLLEREALLAKVEHGGIPVVVWRGPGTLDEVLRRLGRRASQPRLVRR